MNYYPFHLGDYATHTGHLEPLEDLAYRRMLDLYYTRECALPESPDEICRLVRMRESKEEVCAVLNEFFELTEVGWSHSRCDKEIARMKDKQTKAKASAEASVRARSANAQRTLSERSADVELPTPTPTPTPTPDKYKSTRAPRFDAHAHLVCLGVPDNVASDWLAVRKAKRAATTMTAIEGLERECAKAGMTLTEGVKMCAERGWQSLKAEWLANASQGSPPRPPTRDQLRTVAAQTRLSDIFNDDGTPKDLTDGRTIDARAPRLLG